MTRIQNMQKHLATLRKSLGMTQEDLARELGVSRATVNGLERFRAAMTKLQYLAIKCFVYERLAYYKGDELVEDTYMAMMLMDCYIDGGEWWFESKEQETEILDAIELFAESAINSKAGYQEANVAFCRWLESQDLNHFH